MRRALALLFPGDRRVWAGVAVAVVPILLALGHSLTKPRPYRLGSNSVGTSSLVVDVRDGHRLCVPQLELPAGTGQVQLVQFTPLNLPSFAVEVIEGGRPVAAGRSRPGAAGSFSKQTIPISPALPARPAVSPGTICVTPHGETAGRFTQFGGMQGLESTQGTPTLDGRPIGSRISVWFLPPPGAQRSLLGSWSAMMDRVALFRPGFAGPWLFYLLFVGVLPLLAYAALRLLAVADQPRRRLARGLAAVGLVSALTWAITISPFDSPDESEHFAYTEAIAEQGRAPDSSPSPRSPYPSDLAYALEATHHFSTIETPDAPPPWLAQDEARYRARVRTAPPPRGNGGGFSVATGVHSPLYYSLLVPAYELGRSGGIFTELFWVRLASALISVIVVLCAYGIVRELAPGHPRAAVAAGLLVAFEPMFAFISGAVNNDTGVNACAAGLAYLLVRALRRGLSLRLGLGVGVVAGALPLMKATGFELFPAALVALALLAGTVAPGAGRRPRAAATRLAAASAGLVAFAGVTLTWSLLASSFHRSTVTTPGGTTPTSTVLGGGQLGGHFVYLWETFLPRLPFMAQHWTSSWPFYDIYVKRGFGAFGWYDIVFNEWVYQAVVVVMGLAVAGIAAGLVGCWPAIRVRWRELLVLTLVVLGVFGGVEYAYYAPRPRSDLPEQGRYAFPAIAPLAALAAFGAIGFGRRLQVYCLSVLVTLMIGLASASHFLYLANRYT